MFSAFSPPPPPRSIEGHFFTEQTIRAVPEEYSKLDWGDVFLWNGTNPAPSFSLGPPTIITKPPKKSQSRPIFNLLGDKNSNAQDEGEEANGGAEGCAEGLEATNAGEEGVDHSEHQTSKTDEEEEAKEQQYIAHDIDIVFPFDQQPQPGSLAYYPIGFRVVQRTLNRQSYLSLDDNLLRRKWFVLSV